MDHHHARRARLRAVAAALPALVVVVLLLVGPPWALARFVGWPLPDHVPSLGEILAVATSPPDNHLVLSALTCVCWLAWAALALDVVLSTVEGVALIATAWRDRRDTRLIEARLRESVSKHQQLKVWRPGAALIGVLLVALLATMRPASSAIAAVAPTPVVRALPAPLNPGLVNADKDGPGWVTVQAPARGVHDSLWRISGRALGDPTRWPELYEQNEHRAQPDGRTLMEPDLIQPGWHLALPASGRSGDGPSAGPDATNPDRVEPQPNSSTSGSDLTAPPTPAGTPFGPADGDPSATPSGSRANDAASGWIEIGPSLLISTGLAAVLAAGLAVVVHRRRGARCAPAEAHEACDAENAAFPAYPVVAEIARELTRTTSTSRPTNGNTTLDEPAPDDGAVDDVGSPPVDRQPADSLVASQAGADPWTPLLQAAHATGGGLGVAGPGADSVLRARLVELVINRPHGVEVMIEAQLVRRIGLSVDALRELGLTIIDDLDRYDPDDDGAPGAHDADHRTRAYSSTRANALLLTEVPITTDLRPASAVSVSWGHDPDGLTVYVRAEGVIAAAAPEYQHLVSHQLPHIDLAAANEMLELAEDTRGMDPEVPEDPDDGPGQGFDAAAVDEGDGDTGNGLDVMLKDAGVEAEAGIPGGPLWLGVGASGRDAVGIDLAAGAVSISGPGSILVARTLLHRLLTHTARVQVSPQDEVLDALLHTRPHDRHPDERAWHPRLDPTKPGPAILQLAEIEIRRRTTADGPPAPTSDTGSEPAPRRVLFVTTPTSDHNLHRLAQVLDAGRDVGITAVLLSNSDTDSDAEVAPTHLHVDEHGRVISHHRRSRLDRSRMATDPTHLAGVHLATTSVQQLLTLVTPSRSAAPTAPQPDPALPEATVGPDSTEDDVVAIANPAPPEAMRPDLQRPAVATPTTPLSLTVLGDTTLRFHPENAGARDQVATDGGQPYAKEGIVVEGLGPRALELLLYLAAHPAGVPRDRLVGELWPDSTADRPSGPLYNLLARIRRTLRKLTAADELDGVIVRAGDKFRLNLDLVSVDYIAFLHAAADVNDPDPEVRTLAGETVVALYRGTLGRDHPTYEWLLGLQVNARYHYLSAITSLAQLTLDTDPDRTLRLLETARHHEPVNEDVYRGIMTVHYRQGRPDAALNTFALLQASLTAFDESLSPDPATVALATHIRDSVIASTPAMDDQSSDTRARRQT